MRTPRAFTILPLALWVAGCALLSSERDVPTNIECTEENAAHAKCQQQTMYFKDELEPDVASGGGDRPAIAGCHVSYSDSNCRNNRAVYAGDKCTGSGANIKLMEWTNEKCHRSSTTVIDRKPYDCNKWCKKQGHAAGDCKTTVAGVCGTKTSAYCKCTGSSFPSK